MVEVARRHSVSPQQVTAWRRQARQGRLALPAEEETAFAGLLVEDARPAPSVLAQRPIEIEANGVIVRLAADASALRVAEIAAALRAAR